MITLNVPLRYLGLQFSITTVACVSAVDSVGGAVEDMEVPKVLKCCRRAINGSDNKF